MSRFSEDHCLPYKERKGKRRGSRLTKWQKADDLVGLVYVDLCNGFTKSDILEKLQGGAYNGFDALGQRQSYEYLKAAFMRMQYDFQQQCDELRADLYAKMMTVYSDCMKNNDRYNALLALDKIMKLTGVANDKPQTAIQINSDKENGIVVNFGFNKDENVSDSQ